MLFTLPGLELVPVNVNRGVRSRAGQCKCRPFLREMRCFRRRVLRGPDVTVLAAQSGRLPERTDLRRRSSYVFWDVEHLTR